MAGKPGLPGPPGAGGEAGPRLSQVIEDVPVLLLCDAHENCPGRSGDWPVWLQ